MNRRDLLSRLGAAADGLAAGHLLAPNYEAAEHGKSTPAYQFHAYLCASTSPMPWASRSAAP